MERLEVWLHELYKTKSTFFILLLNSTMMQQDINWRHQRTWHIANTLREETNCSTYSFCYSRLFSNAWDARLKHLKLSHAERRALKDSSIQLSLPCKLYMGTVIHWSRRTRAAEPSDVLPSSQIKTTECYWNVFPDTWGWLLWWYLYYPHLTNFLSRCWLSLT